MQIIRKLKQFAAERGWTIENIEQIGSFTFYVDIVTSGFFSVRQTWKVNFCGDDFRAKQIRVR